MGWLSKIFGIDAKRNAAAQAKQAADQAAVDRAAALEQEKKTAAETAAYQQSLLEQARNAAALQSANDAQVSPEVSNVIAGGSAEQSTDTLKRKRPVQSVASTLGINV